MLIKVVISVKNKTNKGLLLLPFVIFAINSLAAQTPAPPHQGVTAITGGTVYTMSDTGVLENATVVFENGIITAVGTDAEIPENATVIDASGKRIYPGFIHGRSTLGLTEISRIQESTDLMEVGDINPNIRAFSAFHPVSEHIPKAAVHGVTTVIPTTSGSLIAGRLSAMETDGWTWEQMALKEDIGMAVEWPSMNNMDRYKADLEKLNETIDRARRYKKAREAAAGGNAPSHAPDIRLEALIPVLKGEMPLFISAGELRQIQEAITWTEKEELKAVLIGGRDMDLLADQLAERNIPVILSGVISGPHRQWDAYNQGYRIPYRLYQAGVEFAIAGDASAAYAYRIHHHAASAVAFGLPYEAALRAVTIDAARILGIDDITGSIETGKMATMMITSGDPLELWTEKEMVFIGGRQTDMTDKDKRLFLHYMEKHNQKQSAE